MKTTCLFVKAFAVASLTLVSLISGCGGAGSESSEGGQGALARTMDRSLTPLIQDGEIGNGNGGGNSTLLPINICTPGHQQLLSLNISNIYMLDSSDKPLPYTQADLSETRTGTITVGSQTYNVSWLNVWFNQLFAPNAQNGSPFTRISWEVIKDPRYQIWAQTQGNAGFRFAFLEDVLTNPAGFTTVSNVGTASGLELVNNPSMYARLLDNGSFPLHAFQHPTPALNWVSNTANRKIIVAQFCAADLEDTTQPIDPVTGFRPQILASSNPVFIEVNEEVSPHLPKGFPN